MYQGNHLMNNTDDEFSSDENEDNRDLLDEYKCKINEKFVLSSPNEADKEAKRNCKILKFSLELSFGDVLKVIKNLELREFPNLFIFVIETNYLRLESSKNLENLQKTICKPMQCRPLILQLTSRDEQIRKFYYKSEHSNQLLDIDEQEKKNDFLRFLRNHLNHKYVAFDDLIEKLPKLQQSSLIIKFLRIFNLKREQICKLILNCASFGSINDLLAALDEPFNTNGKILSDNASFNLFNILDGTQTMENKFYNEEVSEDEGFESDFSSNSETSLDNINNHLDQSILHSAVVHKNTEIINYLTTNFAHLINKLPFHHQVRISTTTFKTDQLDVLCDLLNIADFPFPKDFKADFIDHKRLRQIIKERNDFKAAIIEENFEEMKNFIDINLNLKLIYNPSNNPALTEAVNLKKFVVYFYLKFLGFQGHDNEEFLNELNEEERQKAINQAKDKIKKYNIKSFQNVSASALKLSMKSTIHNKRISKEQEANYRQKIMKWYSDIYTVAQEMLDVAASCESLKIIFDFESESVENASLEELNSIGVTYPSSKLIFIGAKLMDMNGEQYTKGVLAHELCHYVMHLVYENQSNPYYKHRNDKKEIFDQITKAIDKWSFNRSKEPDDECDGIISSVFRFYKKKEYNLELIARVVHILVEFDDDVEKSNYLQNKYKELFDFWYTNILRDLQKFNLTSRKNVRKVNRAFKLLQNIRKSDLDFVESKIKTLIDNKLAIVTTNVPRLLLIDIFKNLSSKSGILVDAKNIFVDPEKLKNPEIFEDFKKLFKNNLKLNIFVDYSSYFCETLKNVDLNSASNIFFIVNSKHQAENVKQNMSKIKFNQIEVELNYNWNDLTVESQNLLLKTEINFQNNSQISFLDLITKNCNLNEPSTSRVVDQPTNFTEIIDNQLLNLLIEKNQIIINKVTDDLNFNFLYQPRKFNSSESSNTWLSENKLISEVRNEKYVIISDIAGNGKSWTLRKIANSLMQQYPTNWVTYVDLKQFIQLFTPQPTQKAEPDFLTFFTENILKFDSNFKLKIFQKMYEIGKVFIIFDGFDEIAPNCVEFVTKLAKSLKSNDGNQLWIATRDHLKVNLQTELETQTVYRLNNFSQENGINLITKSWILNEPDFKNVTSKDEFEIFIKESSKYKDYIKMATRMVKNVSLTENRSIGLPQLFKIIAELSKEDKEGKVYGNEVSIYKAFVEKVYERCSSRSQNSSFHQIHQYLAIKSLFPKCPAAIFRGYDTSEWTMEKIISCGIINVENGEYIFSHKTFRDYFAADFILKCMKKPKIDKNVLNILVKVLTRLKFDVIRMFLNDTIDFSKIKVQKLIKFQNDILNMKIFVDYFKYNLKKLAKMILNIVKYGEYEESKKFLTANFLEIIKRTSNSNMILKLQKFLISYLELKDLKLFIKDNEILQTIILSNLSIHVLEDLIKRINENLGTQFISEILKMNSSYCYDGNILHLICWSSSIKYSKLCLKTLRKYLTINEILQLIRSSNKNSETIFHICIQKGDKEMLKFVWKEIENFLFGEKLDKNLNELVMQKSVNDQTILHLAAFVNKTKFHETLWTLLLETFHNSEEFKKFILQKDFDNFTFLNYIVNLCKIEIIELTFKKLVENFSNCQYQEILKLRDINGRNLLQFTVTSNNFEPFKLIFEIFQISFINYEQFLEFLQEIDRNSEDIFHIAVTSNSIEIFKFMLTQISEIATTNQVRMLLKGLGTTSKNLLQTAGSNNKSIDFHQFLWETLQKYFSQSELLNFIRHVDDKGENILFIVVSKNTKEIVEFTWNEIKRLTNHDEQSKILKTKTIRNEDILKVAAENPEVLKFVKELLVMFESPNGTDSEEVEENINEFIKLINAVIENDLQRVHKLLEASDIDVNCVDRKYLSAIDYAWINYIHPDKTAKELKITEKIMLKLLDANSKFPNRRVDFDYDRESEDVQCFIDFTDQLKILIKQHPNLAYFYERNIQNILLCALRIQRAIVRNKINSQVTSMDVDIETGHQPHIMMILLKSQISNNHNYSCVMNALEQINKIKSCSIILKVVAVWKDVDIIFDFNKISKLSKFDVDNKVIEIGANELMNDEKKFVVIGQIIHELCHLAMYVTFMNGFNPYPMGQSELKAKFERIFEDIKMRYLDKRKIDGIVKNVFESHQENQHQAELIVTVVQIVMNYYENPAKISRNQQHLRELFEYLDNLLPEFEKTISILKTLQNRRHMISYSALTDHMQAKILNSKIKFQSEDTTLAEMIGNDQNILNMLISDEIRKVLLKNETIEIVKCSKINVDFYIERNFFDGTEVKTIEELVERNTKTFILSELPGAGKTTTFEYLTVKLKELFKSSWVHLIKMNNLRENLSKNKNIFNTNDVETILIHIFKITNNIEINILKNLYKNGKMILIFDAFDEICPEFSEIIIKMLKNLRENSNNQIWISTRPHYSKCLEKVLKTNSYKFVPLTKDDRKKLINDIIKLPKNSSDLEDIFDLIECRRNTELNYDINNPLMIKIIVELYEKDEIIIDQDSINLYDIYEKMVDSHKNNLYRKIPHEDNLSKNKFTSDEMHHVMAFKSIFKSESHQNLAIIKNWEIEKSKWKIDKIQRFGFITLNFDENCIDFIHQTYAEFFTTKFIISFLFDSYNSFKYEEYEKIFYIIRHIGSSNKFEFIHNFLFDYIKNNSENGIVNYFKSIMIKNLIDIFDDIIMSKDCLDTFKFWVILLPEDCSALLTLLNDDEDSSETELTPELLRNKLSGLKKMLKINN